MYKNKEALKKIEYKAYEIKRENLEKGLSEGLGGYWSVSLENARESADVTVQDGYGCDNYETRSVYALIAVNNNARLFRDSKRIENNENVIVFRKMVSGGYYGSYLGDFSSSSPKQRIILEDYNENKYYGQKLENIINKLAIENVKEILADEKKELNEKIAEIKSHIKYENKKLKPLNVPNSF